MNEENQTLLNNDSVNMEELLNQTLDNTVAAPDYVTPPPGEYTLRVKSAEAKKPKAAGKNATLVLTYEVVSTIAVEEGEMPVPDGSIFSENYQFTDTGLPYFKKQVQAILNVTNLDGVSVGVMLQEILGTTFDSRITIKKSPNPKGGEYENVMVRVIN